MGETTAIQWTDHTFNPWIGCTKVHTGCTNCYAEKLGAARLGVRWGDKADRRVTADSTWKHPQRWANAAKRAGVRRRVFCASLADVLDERAPEQAQARLWDVIRNTAAALDWQLLTKRPDRWRLIPEDVRPLVWLGTSIADQKTAGEWISHLLGADGFAKRFISAEPLVGPVDFNACGAWHPSMHDLYLEGIDWVIVGGESGPGARPFDLAWARKIVEQCAHAKVPCFVKQMGARAWCGSDESDVWEVDTERRVLATKDKKGGDWSEWPADLRVREFPVDACVECGDTAEGAKP